MYCYINTCIQAFPLEGTSVFVRMVDIRTCDKLHIYIFACGSARVTRRCRPVPGLAYASAKSRQYMFFLDILACCTSDIVGNSLPTRRFDGGPAGDGRAGGRYSPVVVTHISKMLGSRACITRVYRTHRRADRARNSQGNITGHLLPWIRLDYTFAVPDTYSDSRIIPYYVTSTVFVSRTKPGVALLVNYRDFEWSNTPPDRWSIAI